MTSYTERVKLRSMSKTNLTFTEADVWELRTRRLRDVVARLQRTLGKRKRTIARLRSEKAEVIDVLKAKINKLADVVMENVTLPPDQGFTAVLPDYDNSDNPYGKEFEDASDMPEWMRES